MAVSQVVELTLIGRAASDGIDFAIRENLTQRGSIRSNNSGLIDKDLFVGGYDRFRGLPKGWIGSENVEVALKYESVGGLPSK